MPATSPPSITALPTPPDPADRSTYNTRAYPWSVAQQTLATEVAAVATNVYNNATEAATAATTATSASAAAVGAANFKGAWSSLSGALAIPASVSHSSKVWLLTASVADVTAHTPGVSANWLDVSASAPAPSAVGSAVTVASPVSSVAFSSIPDTALASYCIAVQGASHDSGSATRIRLNGTDLLTTNFSAGGTASGVVNIHFKADGSALVVSDFFAASDRHVVVFTLAATPSAFTFSMGAGDIDAGTFTLIRIY